MPKIDSINSYYSRPNTKLIATDPKPFFLIILIHRHNASNPIYFLFGEWCGSGYLLHKYIISWFLLVCEEVLNGFCNSLVVRGVNFSLDIIEKELISFCLDVKGKEKHLVGKFVSSSFLVLEENY